MRFGCKVPRSQKILKTDISEQLGSYPIGNAVDDLAATLRRIDVNPKRPPAKWGLDDLDDRFGDYADVGDGGLERRDTQTSDHAAVGAKHLAIDPGAVGTGQESDGGSDVLRRPQALKRIHFRHAVDEFLRFSVQE